MNIITLSREFGSGGRELGRRLADYLNYAYYDKEILSSVAQQGNMEEGYVQRILENGASRIFPITYGRTFSLSYQKITTNLLLMQKKILKELAVKGDCIIVGRGADAILQDYHPFNLFIYADTAAKMKRCHDYSNTYENLTEKELLSKMRQIDNNRRKYYALCTGEQWGAKENYHMCINTTGLAIKNIASAVGEYSKLYLARKEK